jgi:hypothetical protein
VIMRRSVRLLAAVVSAITVLVAPAAATPTGDRLAPPPLSAPMVGFSFSPAALSKGTNPELALDELLSSLQPDIVRLPVYWSVVAPTPNELDYAAIDGLINTVQAHNAKKGSRQTRLVLVVGARNLVFPDVHLPKWLATQDVHALEGLLKTTNYRRYLETTFQRYDELPLLYAWQLENEPFDNAPLGQLTNGALSQSLMRSEVDLLKSIDPTHEVVVTTFNSAHVSLDLRGASPMSWLFTRLPGAKPAGHPLPALTVGDVLGLDLYVVTKATPITDISVGTRISWKDATLDYWQQQAQQRGKSLWITEMQATPWSGTTGFKVEDLIASALAYRGHQVRVYLLWGVENWLTAPDWMSAGITSIKILRGDH